MSGLLYSDYAVWTDGQAWIAVADAGGQLLAAQRTPERQATNLGELEAALLATQFIEDDEGVILTDSTTVVKALVRDRDAWHWRARRLDEHVDLAERILKALPDDWTLAWAPRKLNKADGALHRHLLSLGQTNA